MASAEGPQRRWWALTRRDPVLVNRERLHSLAAWLAGPRPAYVRGIAILNELLSDGTGPAYTGTPQSLARRLDDAREALEG